MNAFAEHFIEASPWGIIAGANNEAFKDAIVSGYSFYQSIGICSMDILSQDVSVLNALHALVKIHWRSVFLKPGSKDSGEVEFDVFYLVQDRGTAKKIFAYITGDEQRALKELGLINPA